MPGMIGEFETIQRQFVKEHIDPKPTGMEFDLLQVMRYHRGFDKRIPSIALAQKFGYTGSSEELQSASLWRKIRDTISYLRFTAQSMDDIICSASWAGGYWLCSSTTEYEAFKASEYGGRAKTIFSIMSNMDKAVYGAGSLQMGLF